MKTLIFTPLWKRPEIFREFVKSYERLRKTGNFDLLVIVSPEDPFYEELSEIIPKDAYIVLWANLPFGKKKNVGLQVAKFLSWDYLMELNSDSIVNPALMDLYAPLMESATPFFGLNNLYAVDWYTKKTIFLENYNCGMSFGAGQMLHRDFCPDRLWPDDLNEGMDTAKIRTLKAQGVDETVVDCGDTPMIIDLKVNTTIWHFKLLEKRGIEVPYEKVAPLVGAELQQ